MDAAQTVAMVEQVSWFVVYCGQIVLLFRLWQANLLGRYRYFCAFIALDILQSSVLFFIPRDSNAYAISFVVFASIQCVMAVFVVLELYGLVLRGFKGIGSLGRWVTSGGMAVSFIVAMVSLYPDLANPSADSSALLYLASFQRGVYSALLFFLLLITLFLIWFPVPLSRNTVSHTIVFAVYFSAYSVLLLIRNVAGADAGTIHLLSALYEVTYALCVLAWSLLLTEEGERQTIVFGHRWSLCDSNRLIDQLDTLNATLLRTARK